MNSMSYLSMCEMFVLIHVSEIVICIMIIHVINCRFLWAEFMFESIWKMWTLSRAFP